MTRISVGALLVWRGEEPWILLGKRAPDRALAPNVWDVPGGHREQGETREDALVRELREELAIAPKVWRLRETLRGVVPGGDEPAVLHLYEVTAWTGAPRNGCPREHTEIAWFSLEAACALPLAHPAYPALFRRVLHRPRFRERLPARWCPGQRGAVSGTEPGRGAKWCLET